MMPQELLHAGWEDCKEEDEEVWKFFLQNKNKKKKNKRISNSESKQWIH